MKYIDKLKDPRWQKRRLEILQRDNWECQHCHDKTKTLHVHHFWYGGRIKDEEIKLYRRREPWEYDDESLLTLCEDCHLEEKEMRDSAEADLITVLKQKGYSWLDLHNLITDILDSKDKVGCCALDDLMGTENAKNTIPKA